VNKTAASAAQFANTFCFTLVHVASAAVARAQTKLHIAYLTS